MYKISMYSNDITLQPLQIKSAVAVEGLKGYIYIEAYKQTHVKQVITITVVCVMCMCVCVGKTHDLMCVVWYACTYIYISNYRVRTNFQGM